MADKNFNDTQFELKTGNLVTNFKSSANVSQPNILYPFARGKSCTNIPNSQIDKLSLNLDTLNYESSMNHKRDNPNSPKPFLLNQVGNRNRERRGDSCKSNIKVVSNDATRENVLLLFA